MNNTYVSIIGTQPMSVLNPLSVLINEGFTITCIKLLATTRTADLAQNLKKFLLNRLKFPESVIDIIPICSADSEKENKLSAEQAFSKILNTDDMIFFNTAGGMNFQIAACIKTAEKNHLYFLYPESTGVHLIEYENKTIKNHAQSPTEPLAIKTKDILDLQGVQCVPIDNDNRENKTHTLLKQNNLISKIPPGAVRNIQINAVDFDYIWADRNELVFITSLWYIGKKNKEYYLSKTRNILNAAQGRSEFKDLFHRRVIVITDEKYQKHRIEGASKLEIIFIDWQSTINLKGLLTYKLNLNSTWLPSSPSRPQIMKQTLAENPTASVLFVDLGKDILPTLIALFSHRPDRVVFIYTPGEAIIDQSIKSIKANAHLLARAGVKQIEFYPAGYAGLEILDIPDPPEKKIWMNISPGLKGHIPFLVMAATRMGGDIFSIDNSSQTLKNLLTKETIPLSGPDPETLLVLKGEKLLDPGMTGKDIQNREAVWEGILSFIHFLTRQNESIKPLFREKVTDQKIFDGAIYKSNKGKVSLFLNERHIHWRLNGGEWFELLIGYVMLNCGADDVRVRIRTRQSEEIEEKVLKYEKKTPHKDDIDVVARFKNQYFVISCKATEKKSIAKYSQEAKAFSHIFGRFVQPMLCFLKYEGQPVTPQDNNGVTVFGYQTFMDPEKMKSLLNKASVSRQTTREVHTD